MKLQQMWSEAQYHDIRGLKDNPPIHISFPENKSYDRIRIKLEWCSFFVKSLYRYELSADADLRCCDTYSSFSGSFTVQSILYLNTL